jgi:hypothetical protein
MVSGERDLKVDWQPFSLAIKNDELDGTKPDKTLHGDTHRAAHRVLRVIEAATAQGASRIDLYNEFGKYFHIGGDAYDDALIAKVLYQQSLPAELAEAAHDAGFDEVLAQSNLAAMNVAGQDIGVPTIIFTAQDGSKSGYFGPVLQQLPEKDQALKLWDSLSTLASDPNFYELKRARPEGNPDVASTAKC